MSWWRLEPGTSRRQVRGIAAAANLLTDYLLLNSHKIKIMLPSSIVTQYWIWKSSWCSYSFRAAKSSWYGVMYGMYLWSYIQLQSHISLHQRPLWSIPHLSDILERGWKTNNSRWSSKQQRRWEFTAHKWYEQHSKKLKPTLCLSTANWRHVSGVVIKYNAFQILLEVSDPSGGHENPCLHC